MASPVVTGVAALLLEFYPNLTPQQLKYCIVKSAVPLTAKVIKPGTQDELVNMSDLSVSGGIVNAYDALKLASTLNTKKGDRSTLSNKKD